MAPSAFPSSPDDLPPAETGSFLTSFGSVVGAGILGSAIATTPAFLRLDGAPGICSPLGAWSVSIAAMALPMCVFVVALRRARAGVVALGLGKDRIPVAMLLAWLASTFVTLVLVGALLRARTHHHALAGATFAIVGTVLSLLLALIWTRLSTLARHAPRGGGGAVALATGIAALAGIALAVAVVSALRGLTRESALPLPPLQNVKLVDGMAFVVGALIASGRTFVNRRLLAILGPPLAAAVVVLGVSSLRACPSLCEALRGQAPFVTWMVGLFGAN